jgi:hypothetical protein
MSKEIPFTGHERPGYFCLAPVPVPTGSVAGTVRDTTDTSTYIEHQFDGVVDASACTEGQFAGVAQPQPARVAFADADQEADDPRLGRRLLTKT